MPYVITTKSPARPGDFHAAMSEAAGIDSDVVSRRAVATLEDVLRHVADARGSRGLVRAVAALPESGGSVGPLPDGTVIEVEPVALTRLWDEAGCDRPMKPAEIIAAYNAREAS